MIVMKEMFNNEKLMLKKLFKIYFNSMVKKNVKIECNV